MHRIAIQCLYFSYTLHCTRSIMLNAYIKMDIWYATTEKPLNLMPHTYTSYNFQFQLPRIGLSVRHLLVQKTALAEHFNDSDLKAFLHKARSQGAHCRLPVVSIFHKFDSKGPMTKRSKTTNAFTQSLCSTTNRWHLLCGNLMMGFDLMCHTPLMDLSKMPLVQCVTGVC